MPRTVSAASSGGVEQGPAVSARRRRRVSIAVGCALALCAAVYVSVRSGEGAAHRLSRWSMEPTGPDSVDYDNLALSLASGRGFAYDWSDPEALRPYREAADRGRLPYDPTVLDRATAAHPTALRPPAYPFLLAAVYRVFGRDAEGFAVARLLNCFGVGVVGWAVFRLASRSDALSGWIAAAFVAVNLRLITASGHLASDVIGAAAGALLLAALARALEERRAARYLLVGALLGGGILVRSLLGAVAPWVVLAAIVRGGAEWRRRAAQAFALAAGLALMLLPWSLRNLSVGGQLTVTTQTLAALPAGYTRACWEANGAWLPPELQPELESLRGLDEWSANRRGPGLTWELIGRHRELLPGLVARKLERFWSPRIFESRHERELGVRLADALLLLGGGLGALLVLRDVSRRGGAADPSAIAAALLVVGVSVGVALTFEVDRFRIVLAAPLALLAARASRSAISVAGRWMRHARRAR